EHELAAASDQGTRTPGMSAADRIECGIETSGSEFAKRPRIHILLVEQQIRLAFECVVPSPRHRCGDTHIHELCKIEEGCTDAARSAIYQDGLAFADIGDTFDHLKSGRVVQYECDRLGRIEIARHIAYQILDWHTHVTRITRE